MSVMMPLIADAPLRNLAEHVRTGSAVNIGLPWNGQGAFPLQLSDTLRAVVGGEMVRAAPEAMGRVTACHDYLLGRLAAGTVGYGIDTGFGSNAGQKIPADQLRATQLNLMRSHASRIGPFLPPHMARAMLFHRAQTLSLGHSGVRPEVILKLIEFVNRGISPAIHALGSVGASGDLTPSAEMALTLMGEGRVWVDGKIRPTGPVLESMGIDPLYHLDPKEGLALINGTAFMTAVGTFACLQMQHLVKVACLIGALSCEGMLSLDEPFDSALHDEVRAHPGAVVVARWMRELLRPAGEGLSELGQEAQVTRKQRPYSVRAIAQVLGAAWKKILEAEKTLLIETHSVTDNPVIFPEEDVIRSGAGFHGQEVADAMDALSIAGSHMVTLSKDRLQRMIDPDFAGLLPYLVVETPGINSGFMMPDTNAAALATEAQYFSAAAATRSMPAAIGQEDHNSQGAFAARKATYAADLVVYQLVYELGAAAQMVYLRRPLTTTKLLESLMARVSDIMPPVTSDRALASSNDDLTDLIYSGGLHSLVAHLI